MRQGNVGHRLNFGDLQHPEIGLPLLKPKERIMVGTHVLRHRAAPSNGAVEHPAECNAIDRVLDADIRNFYDSLSHEWMLKFIGHCGRSSDTSFDPENG